MKVIERAVSRTTKRAWRVSSPFVINYVRGPSREKGGTRQTSGGSSLNGITMSN